RGAPRCAPALRADAFIPRLRDAASLAARLAVARTACARPRAWSALSTVEFWSRDTCRFSPDTVPRQRFAHVGFPQTHSPAIAAIAGDARPVRSDRRRDRSLGAVSAVERVPSGSTCIPLGYRWGPDGAETTLRLRFASASAAVSRRDWNAGPQRGEPAREGFAG
ncbi:hypothetical protein, partial [Burkholderia pseudomallei]|uniref:hypothetical protein n=1 Tax=Burkholderia pseudomallei TaxID=28450 RepID=UPI001E2E60A4